MAESSMNMLQEYNQGMLYKIMFAQFMNIINVAANILIKYDNDTLALLSGLDDSTKYRVIMEIKKAYVKVQINIIMVRSLIVRNNQRIDDAKKESPPNLDLAAVWMGHNIYAQLYLEDQEALLAQAKSQFAFFRDISIIQAFEQPTRKGSVLGLTQDNIAEFEKKLAMEKDKAKKADDNPKLTEEENEKLKDAGINPSKVDV